MDQLSLLSCSVPNELVQQGAGVTCGQIFCQHLDPILDFRDELLPNTDLYWNEILVSCNENRVRDETALDQRSIM